MSARQRQIKRRADDVLSEWTGPSGHPNGDLIVSLARDILALDEMIEEREDILWVYALGPGQRLDPSRTIREQRLGTQS